MELRFLVFVQVINSAAAFAALVRAPVGIRSNSVDHIVDAYSMIHAPSLRFYAKSRNSYHILCQHLRPPGKLQFDLKLT